MKRFFPEKIFYPKNSPYSEDLSQKINSVTQNQYAKHLTVMNEGPIYNTESLNISIYRFLYLRTFENPIMIKITIENNVNNLKAIILTGQGGYEPGLIDKVINKEIADKEIHEIERSIVKMDFWNLPSSTGYFGMDGSDCMFEIFNINQKYHVIDRWSPGYEDGDTNKYFIELVNYLLKLADITISEKEFISPL